MINLSLLYQKRARQQLVVARSMESQTQTTRKLNTSLLIEVRNRGTADGITAVVPEQLVNVLWQYKELTKTVFLVEK